MMSVDKVERIYNSYSGVYDLIFNGVLQPGRERAVQALGVEAGDRILEVGVGTGLSLPYYPRHCEIVGIDISPPMLRKASDRARELGLRRARFLRMEAERMDLPDRSFDRVVASYVMSTVTDPSRAMLEFWRVCRPGGTIVILNHFGSHRRILAIAERALTPLSRRLGFVLDLSMDMLVVDGLFTVEGIERVNMPPLWSLVRLRRNSSAGH
jgi:phosphatidylethanolamine/phosphatidyl-N-methylethanolamine N-methyltransferase